MPRSEQKLIKKIKSEKILAYEAIKLHQQLTGGNIGSSENVINNLVAQGIVPNLTPAQTQAYKDLTGILLHLDANSETKAEGIKNTLRFEYTNQPKFQKKIQDAISLKIDDISKDSYPNIVKYLDEVAKVFDLGDSVYDQVKSKCLNSVRVANQNHVDAFVAMAGQLGKESDLNTLILKETSNMQVEWMDLTEAANDVTVDNAAKIYAKAYDFLYPAPNPINPFNSINPINPEKEFKDDIVKKMITMQTEWKNLTKTDTTNLDKAAKMYGAAGGTGGEAQFKKGILDAMTDWKGSWIDLSATLPTQSQVNNYIKIVICLKGSTKASTNDDIKVDLQNAFFTTMIKTNKITDSNKQKAVNFIKLLFKSTQTTLEQAIDDVMSGYYDLTEALDGDVLASVIKILITNDDTKSEVSVKLYFANKFATKAGKLADLTLDGFDINKIVDQVGKLTKSQAMLDNATDHDATYFLGQIAGSMLDNIAEAATITNGSNLKTVLTILKANFIDDVVTKTAKIINVNYTNFKKADATKAITNFEKVLDSSDDYKNGLFTAVSSGLIKELQEHYDNTCKSDLNVCKNNGAYKSALQFMKDTFSQTVLQDAYKNVLGIGGGSGTCIASTIYEVRDINAPCKLDLKKIDQNCDNYKDLRDSDGDKFDGKDECTDHFEGLLNSYCQAVGQKVDIDVTSGTIDALLRTEEMRCVEIKVTCVSSTQIEEIKIVGNTALKVIDSNGIEHSC